MSVVPMFYRNWWDDMDFSHPHRLLDQHFGTGLSRDDLFRSFSSFPRSSSLTNSRYYRPWNNTIAKQDSSSTITDDKDKFQVILDVQQFSPNEITVKTNGNSIIIEGKHEEKQDEHGFISRHFIRRYVLPDQHDSNDVFSNLSSDGVLTVAAPKRGAKEITSERVVPISQTGPAKASVTEQK